MATPVNPSLQPTVAFCHYPDLVFPAPRNHIVTPTEPLTSRPISAILSRLADGKNR